MARRNEGDHGAGVIGRSSAGPDVGTSAHRVVGRHRATSATLAPERFVPPERTPAADPVPSPKPSPPAAPERSAVGTRKTRKPIERVLRWTALVVAVVLLAAGALYGYVRYQWGRVQTLACTVCTPAADGQPFNVLIVGSDSRLGNTGAAARAFGSSSEVAGARSDTIKILHVDPAAGTARLLSIPRDTFVQLSGLPSGTGLATENKINAAFNNGPDPLVETIEDTFGIPIQHFVVLDFGDEINLVNAVGGISLDFPFPVRDDDDGNNNSGLDITKTGCQTLNGSMALALSRSRYYQYYDDGYWQSDPTSDIGRIERQNIIIEAVIDKARSTYNPLRLNTFLTAMVHDMTVDKSMSFGTMFSLAEQYHAFSGSELSSYTLPAVPGENDAGDVEIVQEPQAQEMISQFLGAQPEQATTPPLDEYGNALEVPQPSGSVSSQGPSGTSGSPSSSAGAEVAPTSVPFYDPKPC